MLKRKILLSTQNDKKLKEFQKAFSHYGIEVEKTNISISGRVPIEIFSDYEQTEYKIIAIIKETTYIKDKKTNHKYELEDLKDLTEVYHYSKLEYVSRHTFPKKKTLKSKKIFGIIDTSKAREDKSNIFGWDDIFIVPHLNKSLQDLVDINHKVSGRNNTISKFIKKEIYYKERLNLNFNEIDQKETVEFNHTVFNFINTNKYLNMDYEHINFKDIFTKAINNGAFFRSSKNRREKNYWLPGLNAGIPLVAKKDEIHEITFAVHDLCHFVIPDLLVDTNLQISKNTYIIYRMLSEAITMVYADMLFIDMLKENDVVYDFEKRKIYPLFELIKNKNTLNQELINKILIANASYCILGEDKLYRELLGGESISEEANNVLNAFKSKYEPFFVEDYKWTLKNYKNMTENISILNNWTKFFKKTIKKQNLEVLSDKDSMDLKSKEVKTFMTTALEELNSKFSSDKKIELTKEEILSNSFKKYMLGQSLIFFKYEFIPESDFYKDKIKQLLNKDLITEKEMKKIKKFFNNYIKLLHKMNVIDLDQALTYKEIYPLFDSFFVHYDELKDYYPTLKEISESILQEI